MKIAVLCSGGDAPGMNAAVHTVVKVGTGRGHTVLGVRRGYDGIFDEDVAPLQLHEVEGISRMGGTMLGTARCPRMLAPDGIAQSAAALDRLGVDGLVVIGGNGSLTGAHKLAAVWPKPIVGLPASIDNDLGHTMSIGVDTAVNTIVEACDRISDTARAHRRAFIVEVMGRNCGYLAMRSGLAVEADAILYAERDIDEETLITKLRELLRRSFAPGRKKSRVLVVKAEGVKVPTARLVARLTAHLDEDAPGAAVRETVLGHVVRGGSPTATDRVIAQRLAYAATLAVEVGQRDVMATWDDPLKGGERTVDPSVRLIGLGDMLTETARILDGTSVVVKARLDLLSRVEDLLAL